MFLALDEPGGDKHVTLFARNLKGEKNYGKPGYFAFDTERGKFNYAASILNKVLGSVMERRKDKAVSIMPNQFIWQGTSGHEYWTDDYVLVLRHALQVSAELGVPLHLHQDVLLRVVDDAKAVGITFDWMQAKPVKKLHPGQCMPFVNEKLEKGEYFVLSNVVIPEALAVPSIASYEEAEEKRIQAMYRS